MMEKSLISSYDEVNDTFVGKFDGRKGYCADYTISEGINLSVGCDNIPSSVMVNNASEVLNISKTFLENSNVKIDIDCDEIFLNFQLIIEDLNVCTVTCKNSYGIPNLHYVMDSNI